MKNPEKDAARGKRAEQLLNDPLIVEARAHIEAELWRKFQDTLPANVDELSFIKGMQYLHGKYFAFLQRAVKDGRLAEIEIERKKRSLGQRVKEFVR